MKLRYVPLLPIQRELQGQPRNFARFQQYLRTVMNADGIGLELRVPLRVYSLYLHTLLQRAGNSQAVKQQTRPCGAYLLRLKLGEVDLLIPVASTRARRGIWTIPQVERVPPEGERMATFYLLPPRSMIGNRLAVQVSQLLPGVPEGGVDWADLACALIAEVSKRPDLYVVYRDELPLEGDCLQALVDGYGAEPGDEMIEIHLGNRPTEVRTLRRPIGLAA